MDSLHSVLARAMDSEPSERYPTALAFASALEAAARGVTAEATVVAPEPAIIAPEEESAATVVSSRAVPAGKGKKSEKRWCQARRWAELGTRGRGEKDDVLAERAEDRRIISSGCAGAGRVRRDPSLPLDDDIAAEVEMDRFVAEDFLIGAAGAASAAPKKSLRRSRIAICRWTMTPRTRSWLPARPRGSRSPVDDGGLNGSSRATTDPSSAT